MFMDFAARDLPGCGPHTYHPNTFGLLYGKTTKTACSKRVATGNLVSPMQTTCRECQDEIIAAMLETQDMHSAVLEIAKKQGFGSIDEWSKDMAARHGTAPVAAAVDDGAGKER
jgi:hypothetical protein